MCPWEETRGKVGGKCSLSAVELGTSLPQSGLGDGVKDMALVAMKGPATPRAWEGWQPNVPCACQIFKIEFSMHIAEEKIQ